MSEKQVSVSPTGVKYTLPVETEYKAEFDRISRIVEEKRNDGMEIVVVLGLGFVGAVMAATIADSTDANGKPNKFVIGKQRPSVRSYWKIPLIIQGVCPIKSEDPEVETMIRRCVVDKKTFIAKYTDEVLSLADAVVIDIQCDYLKESLGDVADGSVEMRALEETLSKKGYRIRAAART